MRLLGNCPSCRTEDTLSSLPKDERVSHEDYDKVRCENCKIIWDDWSTLEKNEKEKGNVLIPVEIVRMRSFGGKELGVEVVYPIYDEIHHRNLIASVLNSAVLTRFNKLHVNFATEGGVEGVYKRSYIGLINPYRRLGLAVEMDYAQGPGLVDVLDFYEKILRITFEEPLRVRETQYRRGEILRLPKDDENYGQTDKVWDILGAALTKARSRVFAERVKRRLIGEASNPFSGSYLRGLTDEEIVQRFVPPPYFQQ